MEATYERANSKAGICTLRKHTDCRIGSERRVLSVVCMTQTKLGVTMLRDLLQKRISFGHRDARGRLVTHPHRRCNEGPFIVPHARPCVLVGGCRRGRRSGPLNKQTPP